MKGLQGTNGSYVCPCCGYATLTQPARYEICTLCFWEDDGQDDTNADELLVGPNHVSLSEARQNFIEFGASEKKFLKLVRSVNEKDQKLRDYSLPDGN